MISRGRSRRTSVSSAASLSTSQALRMGLILVVASSAIYLFCTHSLLSQAPRIDDPNGSAAVKSRYDPGGNAHFRRNGNGGDPDVHGSLTLFQEDPRGVATHGDGSGSYSDMSGASHPMDYTELRCEGRKPEVDLSYWKDIPTDKHYESPWGAAARAARDAGMPQYVTFEPDHGGFNNIRMAMETMLVFARETGRTLVMPPAQKFYLLSRPLVEFADMFPIEDLNPYMDIISMEEFLEKEGLTGRLGKEPPGGTNSGHNTNVLSDYLRDVADIVPCWTHMEQALVFGLSPDSPEVPTDEASQAWLAEFLTDKRQKLTYNSEMQSARLIHFRSGGKNSNGREYRLFTHFYTFIGFVDPVAARYHRRLVRDVVHFRENLFCVAAIIVGRLRAAGQGTPGTWSGWYGEEGGLLGDSGEAEAVEGEEDDFRTAGFSTFHIRRGDFQYVKMKPPAETIVEATKDLLKPGEVLYIATDERDKSFFEPFSKNHRIFFLDDFEDVLGGIHSSYYLMLDTIVASQGRVFIGTWRSTFTGYITRLRGYYRYPTSFSWYFWNEGKTSYEPFSLDRETTPRAPFFMREWPISWEGIDQDIWD